MSKTIDFKKDNIDKNYELLKLLKKRIEVAKNEEIKSFLGIMCKAVIFSSIIYALVILPLKMSTGGRLDSFAFSYVIGSAISATMLSAFVILYKNVISTVHFDDKRDSLLFVKESDALCVLNSLKDTVYNAYIDININDTVDFDIDEFGYINEFDKALDFIRNNAKYKEFKAKLKDIDQNKYTILNNKEYAFIGIMEDISLLSTLKRKDLKNIR